MARYRTINVNLDRGYRNDLNWNFLQIAEDIQAQEGITSATKTELLAELARIERESKERDNALAKQNLETLLQSIEDAKSNANTAAASATTQAGHAKTQGDYAKTQGDYAKAQGGYAGLKGDYANDKAIEADTAAGRANTEATGLESLKVAVVDATQSANSAATNAQTQGTHAQTQGDYAKLQGDRAKEVVDNAPVISVNEKKGVVTISAGDVGAIPTTEKGIANGVAKLNAAGKVVDASGNEVEGKVSSVNGQVGDVAIPVFSGNYNDLSNKPALKTVATTGSYNDLTNKPAIPAPVTLNNTVTSTSTTQAATANAVKIAYDRGEAAFQSANDGKTAIASAVTAKGVSASPADTFALLASKIGQISTGKKYAEGSITTTGYNHAFTTATGGLAGSRNIIFDMTMLDFIPSSILLMRTDKTVTEMTTWKRENYYTVGANFSNCVSGSYYLRAPYVNGITTLPVTTDGSYVWMAYE